MFILLLNISKKYSESGTGILPVIDGGQDAHPTRKITLCGTGILLVIDIVVCGTGILPVIDIVAI